MLTFFARLPSCLVGIEACGTSHHWARELIKLGHEVMSNASKPAKQNGILFADSIRASSLN
jgi:transposase